MLLRVWLAALCLGAMMTAAWADDWVAVKLRGRVLQLIDNQWQPLVRGDVVPDDRVLRTLRGGRVELHRDGEVISLGPETQIQIHDRTNQRFTTVQEHFGEVSVEAEARDVQHFAVQTPFLVAVVKGTRFTVRSGEDWSDVQVQRGRVAVESEVTHASTVVSAGQSATATTTGELQVAGKGDLPPVVGPDGKVISVDGVPVGRADEAAKLAEKLATAAARATGEERMALEKAAREAAPAAGNTSGDRGSSGNSRSGNSGSEGGEGGGDSGKGGGGKH